VVFGQAGNDTVLLVGCIPTPATVSGGDGNDLIVGGDEADTFFGGNGNDALFGFGGNDSLDGGAGNDALDGGGGNDALQGGTGFLDVLLGGDGNDVLSDADGVLLAWGGDGNDDMTLTFAADWTFNGTPVLPSGAISGGNGNDTIRVTSNNAGLKFDVSGDAGNDRIELYGTWNQVRVFGGAGTDTLKNRGTGLIDFNSIEVFE
jgi:Ca2+-binding RTX toxin-like protein